jgi:hypothetical protein
MDFTCAASFQARNSCNPPAEVEWLVLGYRLRSLSCGPKAVCSWNDGVRSKTEFLVWNTSILTQMTNVQEMLWNQYVRVVCSFIICGYNFMLMFEHESCWWVTSQASSLGASGEASYSHFRKQHSCAMNMNSAALFKSNLRVHGTIAYKSQQLHLVCDTHTVKHKSHVG